MEKVKISRTDVANCLFVCKATAFFNIFLIEKQNVHKFDKKKHLSAMFDTQNSGSVDIHQFNKMFEYINQWLNIFKTYDRNASGLIDDQELNQGTDSFK